MKRLALAAGMAVLMLAVGVNYVSAVADAGTKEEAVAMV